MVYQGLGSNRRPKPYHQLLAFLRTIHAVVTKPGSKVPFKNELMLAYGTAWKTTRIKGTVVAQPTKRKFRVQWTIGEKNFTSEHGAAFFKDQQPVSLVTPTPPRPNQR